MKKIALMMTLLLVFAGVLTACGAAPEQGTTPATQPEVTTAPATEETTAPASMNAVLAELQNLLDRDDETAATAFGGGQENWTEDRSFFIGRIYQVSLTEESVKVFTSYDNDNRVASVSVYLADGSRDVTEEEVNDWVLALTEYAGTEASYDGTSSEAGSKNWKWEKDHAIISLRWLGDVLSMDMVRAVGELQ